MSTTSLGMPGIAVRGRNGYGLAPLNPNPAGTGNLIEARPFPDVAQHELGNVQLRTNLTKATTTIRTKRAARVAEMPDWEDLRQAGSDTKAYVMENLPELLVQFEQAVTARGGNVHWARNADEANEIVERLINEHAPVLDSGRREVIKVKSMATQEIGLNEYLEQRGIDAIETDLAELIVQLGHDRPSHILVPAIHRNRNEIRDIFIREMDEVDETLTNEPTDLAEASRRHLRAKFLSTKVAVSGANFGIAETGTLSIVESEGNGRMCVTLPETLISVMGIEKLLPTFEDLGVFMQLLPRSSTGERMNPYSSYWTGVTEGDGPQNFHVVLLDNGRTRALADEHGRQALHCIRCSACMNVCPVYERTGGHAYGSVYPGPIGSILTPLLTGIEESANNSLPYASSLCGACYDACPVKINIPEMLVRLRAQDVDAQKQAADTSGAEASGALAKGRQLAKKAAGAAKAKLPHSQLDAALSAASWMMSDGRRMAVAERALPLAKLLTGQSGISSLPGVGGKWTQSRTVPQPPAESFRTWWAKNRRDDKVKGSND